MNGQRHRGEVASRAARHLCSFTYPEIAAALSSGYRAVAYASTSATPGGNA
jgi:hypothetical protein